MVRRAMGAFLALASCTAFFSANLFSQGSQGILVTEAMEGRIRVLYIADRAPIENYPQLDFLERNSDLRFIYQRNSDPECGGETESAQICDGVLWDSAGFGVQKSKRIAQLNRYLKRRNFEAVALDGKKLDEETQKRIADYVKDGGHLVWLGPTMVEEGPLSQLCPFAATEGKTTRDEKAEIVDPAHPLLCGIPVNEKMDKLRFSPVKFKENVVPLVRTVSSRYAVMGLMSVGKGNVLGLSTGRLVPAIHQFGTPGGVDTDFLWADFWQQVGRKVAAGEKVPVKLGIHRRLAARPEFVSLSLEDSRGKEYDEKKMRLHPQDREISVELAVPERAASGRYRIAGEIVSGKNTMHRAYAFVTVDGAVDVTLGADRNGYRVGEPVKLSAAVTSTAQKELKSELVIRDTMGIPVLCEEADVSLSPGKEEKIEFRWTMPDYGVEGWAFRADVILKDSDGNRWTSATRWFWRYDPWTMREKFLISNYWGGSDSVPSALMPLFALYHRGIGYNAAHHWIEPYYSRFNMRAWFQWWATMMEQFTGNFSKPDFSHLVERGRKEAGGVLGTAAYVIQDFGEETGFYYHWSNNPFGRTWKKDEDIPEGAHRLFQLYLKEKYRDINNLNAQWQTDFGRFEEVKLSCKHGYPAGWLFLPPPKEVPRNIAPILDTHGFFFWYTQKVAETLMAGLKEQNPTSDWGMSFSLSFNLFSPVPMTMIHPHYNAQVLAPWHAKAVARSKGGNTPLFSFHWGFDEDYRAWGQFWNQSLAALATFVCNWGSQFNYDLTHSRSTLYLKRLMSRMRPREKFFLDCYPVENFDVGIYHPDLDWQEVHSRPNFYLKAQGPKQQVMGQLGFKSTGTGWLGGPEFQVYNVLSASGYTPRFVTEEEIAKCRVLFVPYVETMPESAAARIRRFVADGGLLVTMPVLATHNGYGRPYEEVPGGGLSEVIGLTVNPEIIGLRSLMILPRDSAVPLEFGPRVGGEPPYLWSFGHQQVTSLKKDTQVLLELYEGNPAITLHHYGKGHAVHLNMFTFDHFSQYEFSHFQNETLRQLLDNLVRFAGVTPYLSVERPFLYGIGINEWVQYQYRLKDSDIRVLALYSDKMNGRIVGQVALNEPVAEVFDILHGEGVPLMFRVGGEPVEEVDPFAFTKARKAGLPTGLTFPVELGPADVAFYALVPYRTGPIRLNVVKPAITAGEEPLQLTVTCYAADGRVIPDAHPVHIAVFDERGHLMPMLSRKVTVHGRESLSIPTRMGDPAGKWQVKVTDCVTGRSDAKILSVNPHPLSARMPQVSDIFYPSASPKKIDISDSEFVSLLDALTALYLTGGDRDKGSLSYYVHDRDISRHRIMQLLNQADWRQKVAALRKHLAEGNTVILLGEDLGRDPASGLWLDPLDGQAQDESMDMAAGGKLPSVPGPHKMEALEQLTDGRVSARLWPQGRTAIKFGDGKLILDNVSFDNMGSANGLFDLNHCRWLRSSAGL